MKVKKFGLITENEKHGFVVSGFEFEGNGGLREGLAAVKQYVTENIDEFILLIDKKQEAEQEILDNLADFVNSPESLAHLPPTVTQLIDK